MNIYDLEDSEMLKGIEGLKGMARRLNFVSNYIKYLCKNILDNFNLSYNEYLIIFYLTSSEMTQYQLAKSMQVSPQRINQIISDLVNKEIVLKKSFLENNVIKKNLTLTEYGRNLFKEIRGEANRLELKFDEENGIEDFIKLNYYLERVEALIKKD